MEKPIVDMMSVTLQKIKEMVDVNTIVGQAITAPDGTTIIPVSKLSFGFGSGGSDFDGRNSNQNFGGGSGAGVHISPVAFLVVSKGMLSFCQYHLLPVTLSTESSRWFPVLWTRYLKCLEKNIRKRRRTTLTILKQTVLRSSAADLSISAFLYVILRLISHTEYSNKTWRPAENYAGRSFVGRRVHYGYRNGS